MTERRQIELHLLRHADAGAPSAWTDEDDSRPLSAKGRRQAQQMGAFLARAGFKVDAILCSPKARARETAQLVADALGMAVQDDARLGGRLDLATLDRLVGDHHARRLLLVGHDPDFSELAAVLTGSSTITLSKGMLARIDIPLPLYPGHGHLRWLVPAELLV